MIFGKKSDLKTHLSVKRPTWSHKVIAHSALEQNSEMERREEPPPERNPPPRNERSESIRPRY
jgi:hypothetical protein